jgi:FAD/FMN-containing dehydrogenase
MATADFLAAASALLGPRGFTRDPELVGPWLTDWRGRYTGKALGLASPGSTAEVAALVRLCADHGVPIVPQGATAGCAAAPRPTRAAMRCCFRCGE